MTYAIAKTALSTSVMVGAERNARVLGLSLRTGAPVHQCDAVVVGHWNIQKNRGPLVTFVAAPPNCGKDGWRKIFKPKVGRAILPARPYLVVKLSKSRSRLDCIRRFRRQSFLFIAQQDTCYK